MKYLGLFFAFLLSFPLTTGAFFDLQCTDEDLSTVQQSNIELDKKIGEWQKDFIKAINGLPAPPAECNRNIIEQQKSIWHDFQENTTFNLGAFISSTSSAYNNNCLQRDSEKLIALVDFFQTTIKEKIYNCYSVTENLGEIADIQKDVQDTLDFLERGNGKTSNADLQKLWIADLYSEAATQCPTESWVEVKKSLCKVQDQLASFRETAKSAENNDAEAEAAAEARKKEAKKLAEEYIKSNIPWPLQFKEGSGWIEVKLEKSTAYEQQVKNSFNLLNNLNNPIYQSSSPSNILIIQGQHKQQQIKLLETHDMLNEYMAQYNYSHEGVAGLEQKINALTQSISNSINRNGNLSKNNIYGFMKSIKNREEQANSCSVDLNNN